MKDLSIIVAVMAVLVSVPVVAVPDPFNPEDAASERPWGRQGGQTEAWSPFGQGANGPYGPAASNAPSRHDQAGRSTRSADGWRQQDAEIMYRPWGDVASSRYRPQVPDAAPGYAPGSGGLPAYYPPAPNAPYFPSYRTYPSSTGFGNWPGMSVFPGASHWMGMPGW